MSEKPDPYKYRADGYFLMRVVCSECAEFFDVSAMANKQAVDVCPACKQVDKWMQEAGYDCA